MAKKPKKRKDSKEEGATLANKERERKRGEQVREKIGYDQTESNEEKVEKTLLLSPPSYPLFLCIPIFV